MEGLIKTRWGLYEVLDYYIRGDMAFKIKRLYVYPDQNLSYQFHGFREEHWTIINGNGIMIVDGNSFIVQKGDTVEIPAESLHTVKAGEIGLEIIEIQRGIKCEEEDIQRLYYDWTETITAIHKFKYGENRERWIHNG